MAPKVGKLFLPYFNETIMLWSSFLKMTILHNFEVILQEENDLNPFTRLWCKVFSTSILNHKFLKYIKLAKIVVVQVLGSIEDQWTFNIIGFFLRNKLQNHLNTHLDLWIRFFSQCFFLLQIFPYDQDITRWNGKVCYMCS